MIGFANGAMLMKAAEAGTLEFVGAIFKTMAVDAAGSGAACLTGEMLEDLGLPPAAAMILTAIVSGTVTYSAGTYVFKNASGEVIESCSEAELKEILEGIDDIEISAIKGSADNLDDALKGGLDAIDGVKKSGISSDIGYMKNIADPMRDVMGSGKISNPGEWNSIIQDLEKSGVEINFREGQMAYAPGLVDGSPGQLIIDPDASLSALKHEYQHFLDAQAEGFPAFAKQMYEDPKARVIRELRAYMVEIKEADRLGLNEVSEQLFENNRSERNWIIDQYIISGGE